MMDFYFLSSVTFLVKTVSYSSFDFYGDIHRKQRHEQFSKTENTL